LDSKEQEYSIQLGEKVITEIKLELVCDDERIDEAVDLIREQAHTGQSLAGRVFVSDIVFAYTVGGK
jgi:nitrogen regulatory protein P-II 1